MAPCHRNRVRSGSFSATLRKTATSSTPLKAALESFGYTCWVDRQQIPVPEQANREIQAALPTCRFFVALLSPAYVGKSFPEKEWKTMAGLEDLDKRWATPTDSPDQHPKGRTS